jgi:hypothetical protein
MQIRDERQTYEVTNWTGWQLFITVVWTKFPPQTLPLLRWRCWNRSWGVAPFSLRSATFVFNLLLHRQTYESTNSAKCQFERSKKSRPFLRIFLILDIFLTKKTHTTTVKTIFKKLKKTSYLWDFWWFVTAQIGIWPSLWIHKSVYEVTNWIQKWQIAVKKEPPLNSDFNTVNAKVAESGGGTSFKQLLWKVANRFSLSLRKSVVHPEFAFWHTAQRWSDKLGQMTIWAVIGEHF